MCAGWNITSTALHLCVCYTAYAACHTTQCHSDVSQSCAKIGACDGDGCGGSTDRCGADGANSGGDAAVIEEGAEAGPTLHGKSSESLIADHIHHSLLQPPPHATITLHAYNSTAAVDIFVAITTDHYNN